MCEASKKTLLNKHSQVRSQQSTKKFLERDVKYVQS